MTEVNINLLKDSFDKRKIDTIRYIVNEYVSKGDLTFLTKDVVKEFTKNRFNESLEMIGGNKVFEVDTEKLKQLRWFEEEILSEVNTDFFYKKPVNYSKKVQSIQAEDIF
jgi:ribonucleoside-diphosphate reductase beta chain